jgi:hypothetical protein
MLLSDSQTKAFWRLWAQACRVQGWTRAAGFNAEQIDAHRRDFLQRCGFDSLTKVDRVDGFTRVKKELEILIAPDLDAATETADLTINRARTLRHVIRHDLLPCLSLYVDDAVGFMRAIMQDKNRWWKIDRPTVEMTLEDLDARPIVRTVNGALREFPSQLEQLRMTLNARLHAKRRAAGHSIRQMHELAGKVTPEPLPELVTTEANPF